ncbi:MAG TPA: serine/threonine-protein kinase [Polyangiaceae bacterium]|jgi:serine/threonine-protein kinase|nr:serine/threonine-protein kinase [Polyangiaceae bacterium]
MAFDPKSAYPQPGEVIDGKYQVDRILGQGGMGAVVRAYHLLLRAPVAIKFMNPTYVDVPGAVDRFLNEGVAAKAIISDHVVKVDDVGKLPSGAPYLVMDCLDGRDLAQVLEAEGRPGIAPERVVLYALQVLRALQAAHAAGIIHRDMKPSNCFVVTKDGDPDFVKILDFGISKVQTPGSESLTQTHSALGTPLYMSPEQAKSPKEVDGRTDVYSVSVIMYELLSGRTPFSTESGQLTELLFKLFTCDPDPLETLAPHLPEGLAAVIHKGLAREPDARYSSALAMAEALEPYADERGRAHIQRMRAYVPPEDMGRHSRDIARPSALAFSELGRGAVSGLGPGVLVPVPPLELKVEMPSGPTGTVVLGEPKPRPPSHHDGLTMAEPVGVSHGSTRDAAEPFARPSMAVASVTTPPPAPTLATTDSEAAKSPAKLLLTGAGIALAAVVVAILVTRPSGGQQATPDPVRGVASAVVTAAPPPSAVAPPPSAVASAAPSATASSGPTNPAGQPKAATSPGAPSAKPVSSALRAVQQGLAN